MIDSDYQLEPQFLRRCAPLFADPAMIERRRQVHVACLPMDDLDQNAAIVNALQRRSEVVVQKSLAEGFGLTVAEAMWKARPTLASRVGGIQDQIESGVTGVLLNPDDLQGFGAAMRDLLNDQPTANALGHAGRARICAEYLAPRHLERYFLLVARTAATARRTRSPRRHDSGRTS